MLFGKKHFDILQMFYIFVLRKKINTCMAFGVGGSQSQSRCQPSSSPQIFSVKMCGFFFSETAKFHGGRAPANSAVVWQTSRFWLSSSLHRFFWWVSHSHIMHICCVVVIWYLSLVQVIRWQMGGAWKSIFWQRCGQPLCFLSSPTPMQACAVHSLYPAFDIFALEQKGCELFTQN